MGFLKDVGTLFDVIVNPEEYADKGKMGERFTYRVLKDQYMNKQIFRNLYIKRADGKFTEIDLVSVGRGALFVYESKNYSGWIFGNDTDSHFVQTFPNGKKQRFYSPIRQNQAHIDALKEYLADYPLEFHSIIVFSERCTLKDIKCSIPNTHIIKRDELDRTVWKIRKETSQNLTKNQLEEVILLLSKVQRPCNDIVDQHLENIKEALSTCPRCNGELVERTAKSTGNKFMGCKNFPKCRFTKHQKTTD
jgi:hypothetical protein